MAVLICTGRVGRAGRMKVGRPPSCGVTGAGRTNVAPGAGLARTAEVGVVAANTIKIYRAVQRGNFHVVNVVVPVGREAGGSLPTWLRLGGLTPSMVSSLVARLCWR